MKYDVLIVGGGPAGSMAAIQLIGSGLRVAILDRAHFPRIKPCGGGISCRAYQRFAKLEHVLKSVPTNLVRKLVTAQRPFADQVACYARVEASQTKLLAQVGTDRTGGPNVPVVAGVSDVGHGPASEL